MNIISMPDLRTAPGTYVLHLDIAHREQIEVGRLGVLDATKGRYLYVGSALGPGGVKARVQRHARANKNTHWHIDYVRAEASLRGVWVAYSDRRLECDWARALAETPGATIPMPGFGASDCSCSAHLIGWSDPQSIDRIGSVLRRTTDGAAVHYLPNEPSGE